MNILLSGRRRAAPRGKYARGKEAAQRRKEQATLLNDAVGRSLLRHGPRDLVVDHVLEESGLGRNTFYEHYPNLDAALKQMEHGAAQALGRACDASLLHAHTPREQLRALVGAWVSFAGGHALPVAACLRIAGWEGRPTGLRKPLERVLGRVLVNAHRAGVIAQTPSGLRIRSAVAVLVELGATTAYARRETPEELVEFGVDACFRLFR